jgi:RNA polymerase sigma-70 factor (ECF subfamily)
MSESMDTGDIGRKGDPRFPETNWSLVRRAIDKAAPESFGALSKLCESYWYPLYAYVRREGGAPEDAADEVQGFFASMLE